MKIFVTVKQSKALRKFKKQHIVRHLKKGLRNEGGKPVLKEIKDTIPVNSGFTRSSLKLRTGKANNRKGYYRFRVVAKTDDVHKYFYTENGTKKIKAAQAMKKANKRLENRVLKGVANYFFQHVGV